MNDVPVWPSLGGALKVDSQPFSHEAAGRLRRLLGDRYEEFVKEAEQIVGLQRRAFSEAAPKLKEVRAQLEAAKNGGDIGAAAAPLLKAALLIHKIVSDPYSANCKQIKNAAELVLGDLPKPKVGRSDSPTVHGRDWSEDRLLEVFHRVTEGRRGSIDAFNCSCVVLVDIGVLEADVDPLSRQRAYRRRRKNQFMSAT